MLPVPIDPDAARPYLQGAAWVLYGALTPQRPVGAVLSALADHTAGLPTAARREIGLELARIPDWFARAVDEAGGAERFVAGEIAGLEAQTGGALDRAGQGAGELEWSERAGGTLDLPALAAWGLGYQIGQAHVIVGASTPASLGDMLDLAGARLTGRDRSLEAMRFRALPPVPQALPQRLKSWYVEGFGEALGTRWGTRFGEPPLPAGIPKEALEGYRAAYQRGEGEQFLGR